MVIFKRLEVDMAAARARVDSKQSYPDGGNLFNQRERKALHKFYDLFEAGKWEDCTQMINEGKAFPMNTRGGYHETEHIEPEIWEIFRDMKNYSYYTREELLRTAIEHSVTNPFDK